MQKRYFDRGSAYSFEALRDSQVYSRSQGVYSGFDLSPSALSGSSVEASAGGLELPAGVFVVEDAVVTIPITGTFPPAAATDYTIATLHDEISVGLIGGDAMTYYSATGILTEQPSNGVILGWVRHPGGSIALAQSHITNAPKVNPWDLTQTFAARQPIHLIPPDLVLQAIGANVATTSGYDSTDGIPWRGVINSGGTSQQGIFWMPFEANAIPYQLRLRNIVPGGGLTITVYDTAGTSAATTTLVSNTTWTWTTLAIPSTGTWTLGSQAMVKLDCTVPAGASFQFSELDLDFWPFGLPRTPA